MAEKHYDYFVIGAGSGGVRSARIAAGHGAKVGVAEKSALGGTCVNLGCIPKKLFAYAADYAGAFADARGFGWATPEQIAFDWPTLIRNKNNEISRLNGIYKTLLENSGVEILGGEARFIDDHTLEVGGQQVSADTILIAVGGRPRIPDIEGGELMATSDDVFFWPRMPKKAVIQGGGYIAVEFAHILHGIGAHVTLLYRGALFMRGFDRDIAKSLADEMSKQGIDLRFNCDVARVERKGEDDFIVHTTTREALECDLPLAAIGRDPNVEPLALEKASVDLCATGRIAINEDYQTSAPHIYALGDVANHHNLTPVAVQEGHVLADRLFGNQPERSVNYDNIATAVFSAPPIGTVGLSEEEALDHGHKIDIYVSSFKPMKHHLTGRDERSLMKLIVDQDSDKVLGCHMMGADAPEIIQGFAVAVNCGATKAVLDRTMAIHPSAAEEFVLMRTKKG
ncbi:MAG: glutathione-disulfide reductase [Rhodospirillales bacterium]|nr:glutathione-disulfide reductase [Rhodospirillales bacterium]